MGGGLNVGSGGGEGRVMGENGDNSNWATLKKVFKNLTDLLGNTVNKIEYKIQTERKYLKNTYLI